MIAFMKEENLMVIVTEIVKYTTNHTKAENKFSAFVVLILKLQFLVIIGFQLFYSF